MSGRHRREPYPYPSHHPYDDLPGRGRHLRSASAGANGGKGASPTNGYGTPPRGPRKGNSFSQGNRGGRRHKPRHGSQRESSEDHPSVPPRGSMLGHHPVYDPNGSSSDDQHQIGRTRYNHPRRDDIAQWNQRYGIAQTHSHPRDIPKYSSPPRHPSLSPASSAEENTTLIDSSPPITAQLPLQCAKCPVLTGRIRFLTENVRLIFEALQKLYATAHGWSSENLDHEDLQSEKEDEPVGFWDLYFGSNTTPMEWQPEPETIIPFFQETQRKPSDVLMAESTATGPQPGTWAGYAPKNDEVQGVIEAVVVAAAGAAVGDVPCWSELGMHNPSAADHVENVVAEDTQGDRPRPNTSSAALDPSSMLARMAASIGVGQQTSIDTQLAASSVEPAVPVNRDVNRAYRARY